MNNPMLRTVAMTISRGICTLVFACVALLGPSSPAAEKAADRTAVEEDLRIGVVPGEVSLEDKLDPTATFWESVVEQVVHLRMAPAVHESIVLLQRSRSEIPAQVPLRVRVASDGQRIYFRLRWQDSTRDDVRRIGRYADGVAVQLPATSVPTSPMMGLPDAPVEIWRWTAASNVVEALRAGGPGTLVTRQDGPDQGLVGRAVYRPDPSPIGGEWLVVLARDLHPGDSTLEPLRAGAALPVAFALWQGSDSERGGYKKVSDWITLSMEGGRPITGSPVSGKAGRRLH